MLPFISIQERLNASGHGKSHAPRRSRVWKTDQSTNIPGGRSLCPVSVFLCDKSGGFKIHHVFDELEYLHLYLIGNNLERFELKRDG
jgi:hypothetical protein